MRFSVVSGFVIQQTQKTCVYENLWLIYLDENMHLYQVFRKQGFTLPIDVLAFADTGCGAQLCRIEVSWYIAIWHLDITFWLCSLVSLQRHAELMTGCWAALRPPWHPMFMHIYGRGSLCRLIGILGLTKARDQSRPESCFILGRLTSDCRVTTQQSFLSLAFWCACISIWPWTAE